jgi:hypothetical protein
VTISHGVRPFELLIYLFAAAVAGAEAVVADRAAFRGSFAFFRFGRGHVGGDNGTCGHNDSRDAEDHFFHD